MTERRKAGWAGRMKPGPLCGDGRYTLRFNTGFAHRDPPVYHVYYHEMSQQHYTLLSSKSASAATGLYVMFVSRSTIEWKRFVQKVPSAISASTEKQTHVVKL